MEKNPQENLTSKDYYFDSYSHYGIHEEMLKDTVRTRTYMSTIMRNEHLFKGKAVLDVGCGTGILSMFAARAGARVVYAIDMSSIANQAKDIIADNGFSDVIHIMKCKMEDTELPEKVEAEQLNEVYRWMLSSVNGWGGYALYYESMLPTVLVARDKWLKPGGIILPDRSELKIACIEDEEYKQEKIEFWNNVYGFKMDAIKNLALQEPLVDGVSHESLRVLRNDHIHAFVMWFDIFFDSSHKPISFSTSPYSKQTHWKQTVFYLRDTLTVYKDEVINGRIKCTPNSDNPRDLDFELEYTFKGQLCESSATLHYRMR